MHGCWRLSVSGSLSFLTSKHLAAIRHEVYAYLHWSHGDALPDGAGGTLSFDYKPQALYWLEWVERYGLPNNGGWLDQPFLFMQEIEAARVGRAEFDNEQDSEIRILKQLASMIRGEK